MSFLWFLLAVLGGMPQSYSHGGYYTSYPRIDLAAYPLQVAIVLTVPDRLKIYKAMKTQPEVERWWGYLMRAGYCTLEEYEFVTSMYKPIKRVEALYFWWELPTWDRYVRWWNWIRGDTRATANKR